MIRKIVCLVALFCIMPIVYSMEKALVKITQQNKINPRLFRTELEWMACSVATSPYAKNITDEQVFAMPAETIQVAHKYNTYFDDGKSCKMDVTKDEYNATVLMPFAMRKEYHNDTRFFKAVVMPDFYTKVKRVTLPTVGGAVVGAVVAGTCEIGFQHGKNIEVEHSAYSSEKTDVFTQEFKTTYNKVYNEVYTREVLSRSNPAEQVGKELQFVSDQEYRGTGLMENDMVGQAIFTGGVEGVESLRATQERINNNPDLLKESRDIQRTLAIENVGSFATDETVAFGLGTFSGFFNGVFKKSCLEHHAIASEIAANIATTVALDAAVMAVSKIPIPTVSVKISSGSDLRDRCAVGGLFGGTVGLVYSIWNINNPVVVKRISEIDKPI